MAIVEAGPIRALFMLDLTTAHLPEDTVWQIYDGNFYRDPTYTSAHSFIFYIDERPCGRSMERELAKCPCPAFRAAMKLAWSLNLKFISFDQDAEIHDGIEGLPTFEW